MNNFVPMPIHIGQKIKEITEKRGIAKAELGRRLNMSSTNVHKIFKRESIDTNLLENLSILLEHNFFAYYVEDLPILIQNANNNINSTISQNINNGEVESLREKVNMLEKIIDLMEKKIK